MKNNNFEYIYIDSAEEIGEEEVYDLSVDHQEHSFVHSSGLILHNSAFIVTERPVEEFIPLVTLGDVQATQYTMNACEAAGALKMDYLVLNTLVDINAAIKEIQKKHNLGKEHLFKNGKRIHRSRVIPHKGELYDIYDLPVEQEVMNAICEGDTETVFQLNTSSAKKWLKEFNHWKTDSSKTIDTIEAISAFTALDRPGPLDAEVTDGVIKRNMLQEYAARLRGEQPLDPMDFLMEHLPETMGIIVYQEQLQSIYQKATGCTGTEADTFRQDIGKKKMEKVLARYNSFIERATPRIGQESAQKLWEQIYTFGQYGFNKSLDANTILELSNDSKMIKDCVPGDRIKSVDNFGNVIETEIIALHDHGELEAFEVELDDGYVITCSINHKFLTKKGMMSLKDIIDSGEEILSVNSNAKSEK